MLDFARPPEEIVSYFLDRGRTASATLFASLPALDAFIFEVYPDFHDSKRHMIYGDFGFHDKPFQPGQECLALVNFHDSPLFLRNICLDKDRLTINLLVGLERYTGLHGGRFATPIVPQVAVELITPSAPQRMQDANKIRRLDS